jgi:lactonase
MRLTVVGITCAAAASLGAGVSMGASQSDQAATAGVAAPASHVAYARLFAKVAPAEPGGFGTNLEGAAFDSKGRFYFVNTTAPSGQPKLMSLDLNSRKVTDLYTDSSSMLNCIGFAPNGTMYVCDIKGGRIAGYDAATKQLSNVLTEVDGTSFVPDDIAVDGAGDMYIADYQGTPTDPTGRILLHQAGGASEVALSGVAHPNGIEIGRVVFPGSAPRVTHVAIQPGTRNAYATASGPDGGYIYTFQALAAAPANTPNGG